MNRSVLHAKHFVHGNQISAGMLNCVEAVIRAYDPFFSCSTHAAGQRPLQIQLLSPTGKILDELIRS